MIAFLSLSWSEMSLLLVIGLLLYGRNLPDAGRRLGQIVAQLRRSFHEFKDQLDRDGEIREVKKAFQDTAREVKNVAKVPRAIANPGGAVRELAEQTLREPSETERAGRADEDVGEPDVPPVPPTPHPDWDRGTDETAR